ncbi:hypothetical protein GCM10012275_35180 [Longimycelium tulufanense]|uniref:Uncharacterized protein n=1 Tax=Longimycelium tulufanense TaxID=907463 RepID=A0A8J3FVV4_9PSEU|nr:hypothetical protein GCM10012275_35180 [Longimycelium tulufanense]
MASEGTKVVTSKGLFRSNKDTIRVGNYVETVILTVRRLRANYGDSVHYGNRPALG